MIRMANFQVVTEPVWLIVQRELRDYFRDWRMLLPSLVLTFGFPFLMNVFAYAAVDFVNRYGADLVVERLVPISILIIGFFPLTVSLVGALESFVGEKERGTIEPLLSTPLADWQLYLGKLIVGVIIPLTASLISILIYMALLIYQRMALPSPMIFFQLLLLTFSHAVLMVSVAIVISTQSTSIKGANLLASFIVIPVAILMQGETFLLFWGNEEVIWLGIVAVWILAGLIVRLGLAHFQREYLLGREIDPLNLSWVLRTFWRHFKGEARTLREWYRYTVRQSLKQLVPLLLILVVLALGTVVFSYFWVEQELSTRYALLSQEEQTQRLVRLRKELLDVADGRVPPIKPLFLFLHNLRATLLMAFFGIFSFGVLGVILYMINMSVVGVVLGVFSLFGYSPGILALTGILPHGVFELAGVMFSCAAVLRAGLVLVTPQGQRTIGEVFLEVLANWVRLVVGVSVPLLLIAAMIEVYVTPLILTHFISFP